MEQFDAISCVDLHNFTTHYNVGSSDIESIARYDWYTNVYYKHGQVDEINNDYIIKWTKFSKKEFSK